MRKGKALALLCLLVLVALLVVGVVYLQRKGGGEDSESAESAASSAPVPTAGEVPHVTYTPDIERQNGAALQAAKEENPEVKGWLAVAGTDISVPVTQTGDNSFYRFHDWTGAEGESGACFFDKECQINYALDLSPNVVIYGRKDSALFGPLEQCLDIDFFRANDRVLLTLGDYEFTYQIISVGYLDTAADAPMLAANPAPEEFTEVLSFMEGINLHETAAAQERIISIITLVAYTEDGTQALAVVGKLVPQERG